MAPVATNDRTRGQHRITARTANGNRVRLTDLPLVVARLNCGHLVREYAISKRDLVFCRDCGTTKTVRSIVAQ
jgi:hypothetical protein